MRRDAIHQFMVTVFLCVFLSSVSSCKKLEDIQAVIGPAPCQHCGELKTPVQYLYTSLQNSGAIAAYQVDLENRKTLVPVPGAPFRSAPGTYGLALHPNLKFLYAANYDDRANVITGFSINYETGALQSIGRFRGGRGPTEMIFHPSGRFLYVSNWRSSGNVSAYEVDSESGKLLEIKGSPFQSGLGPRSLAIDPKGRFLFIANSKSDSISVYQIDPGTGALVSAPGSPYSGNGLKSPDGIMVVSEGGGLLVSNVSPSNIVLSGFSVSESDGSLRPLDKSPYLFAGRCQAGCGLTGLGDSTLEHFLVYGGKEGVLSSGLFNLGAGPVLQKGSFVAPPGTSYLNDIAMNGGFQGFMLSSEGNSISVFRSELPWGGRIVSELSLIIPSPFRTDAGKLALTPVFYR